MIAVDDGWKDQRLMHFKDPFVSIGATALLIVERLEENIEKAEHQSEAGRQDDADARSQCNYVNHRLRELAAFERAARGKQIY
jgi:hypothetical protein